MSAIFTISLDFELMWGVRDKRSVDNYGSNILLAREVIPDMLALFEKYDISVSWSTVGLLFAKNKKEMLHYYPKIEATYVNDKFAVKAYLLKNVGENETDDPYHFASSLIEKIKNTPKQEISTHTYTHYYCLEDGQTPEQFYLDIDAAIEIAKSRGVDIKTIVFPRNQVSPPYLSKLKNKGITLYRGNLDTLLRREKSQDSRSLFIRLIRLLDTVFNIDGYHSVSVEDNDGVKNLPASRFLRPFRESKLPGYNFIKRLQLLRVKSEMTEAAKKGRIYHLWWHPHNFGQMQYKNLEQLEEILKHYVFLKNKYHMNSCCMSELS